MWILILAGAGVIIFGVLAGVLLWPKKKTFTEETHCSGSVCEQCSNKCSK